MCPSGKQLTDNVWNVTERMFCLSRSTKATPINNKYDAVSMQHSNYITTKQMVQDVRSLCDFLPIGN